MLDGEGKSKARTHAAGKLAGGLIGGEGNPAEPSFCISGVTAQFGGED